MCVLSRQVWKEKKHLVFLVNSSNACAVNGCLGVRLFHHECGVLLTLYDIHQVREENNTCPIWSVFKKNICHSCFVQALCPWSCFSSHLAFIKVLWHWPVRCFFFFFSRRINTVAFTDSFSGNLSWLSRSLVPSLSFLWVPFQDKSLGKVCHFSPLLPFPQHLTSLGHCLLLPHVTPYYSGKRGQGRISQLSWHQLGLSAPVLSMVIMRTRPLIIHAVIG